MDFPIDFEFLQQVYYGNTMEQYLILLLSILGGIIVGKILYRIFQTYGRRLTAKTKTRFDDLLIDLIEEPIVVIIILLGFWLGLQQMSITPGTQLTIQSLLNIITTIVVTWFGVKMVDAIVKNYVIPIADKSESTLDDEIVPIMSKGLKAIIVILGLVAITGNLGYDLTAVLAGLGIGGLALAFAAKDTIENLFGGLSIFMDRPFKLGDRVKIGDLYGDVKEISFRRTRIKTLDNTIVTVPNAEISRANVENYHQPNHIQKVLFKIGVTYDTSGKKLEEAKKIIKKAITSTEGVTDKEPIIKFTEFGDSALTLLVIYWVKGFKYKLNAMDAVNTKIKDEFEKAKIEFAFPTQTIYVEK